MEIRNITTFLKAAECLHFSKAAEELNYTQAAVTQQIKQLEDELGIKLFDRVHTTISLTEYGKYFVQYANRIIDSVNEAKSFMRAPEIASGPLSIGIGYSLHTCVLVKLLPNFCEKYPLLKISMTTRTSAGLVQMLQKNTVDVIFFTGKCFYDNKWIKVMEIEEDVIFVASAKNKFANKRVPIDKLKNEPFMLTTKGLSYRYDLDQCLAMHQIQIDPVLESDIPLYISKQLQNTNNISFLPTYVVKDDIEKGLLAKIDVEDVDVKTYVQLIHRSDRVLNLQMTVFIQTIQDYYSAIKRI